MRVPGLFSILLQIFLAGFDKNSQSDGVKTKLAPYVTFSLARSGQFASEQEAQDRDICAESLIWAKLISRVHNGEVNPFTRIGKWLYSLIPMHACQQKPLNWAEVFASR